ncbi:MAG: alkaline phosphatase D family protein [Polyangiaceae bacterium]
MSKSGPVSRRRFVQQAAVGGAALTGLAEILRTRTAPAAIASEAARPVASWGLQVGDVLGDRAIVWSRADRASRMFVEWSLDSRFRRATTIRGPHALDVTDYTARIDLTNLPANEDVFVRVTFEDLDSSKVRSEPVLGHFRTAPDRRRNLRFVWGGDTAGQGWGIDLQFGGMKIYEAMRQTNPDFFLHCGDNIYADGPLAAEVTDAAGAVIWRNAYLDVVPEKLKVAETLNEFRRAYLYNLYDANVRRFNAEVPQIWQWDDHEVTNNWSPSKELDARYTEKRVQTLVGNATRAFLEYAPLRPHSAEESERIHRHIPYGRDLDLFVVDMRSYRAGNGCNVETAPSDATAFLGRAQLEWLKAKLAQSRATWKIIAADMPLGLLVGDGTDGTSGCARFENSANGDGPVLGREFEIAEVLRFIKRSGVANVVWLTADVHYCAAHYYDPAAAQFQDFEPFWEFVAGPLHAGTFGPGVLDNTFGPKVVFQKAPAPGQSNLPPSAGLQFFGQVDIDRETKAMTVSLKDLAGTPIFSQVVTPKGR